MKHLIYEQLEIARVCMELNVAFHWRPGAMMLIDGKGVERVLASLVESGYHIRAMEGCEVTPFRYFVLHDHMYTRGLGPQPDATTELSEWSRDLWVHINLMDKDAEANRPGSSGDSNS